MPYGPRIRYIKETPQSHECSHQQQKNWDYCNKNGYSSYKSKCWPTPMAKSNDVGLVLTAYRCITFAGDQLLPDNQWNH